MKTDYSCMISWGSLTTSQVCKRRSTLEGCLSRLVSQEVGDSRDTTLKSIRSWYYNTKIIVDYYKDESSLTVIQRLT